MNNCDTSALEDDINIFDDDDVETKKTNKSPSEKFVELVSLEEQTIINDLSNNEQERVTQTEETETNTPIEEHPTDWIYAFKDIPGSNSLKIEEFGQIYIYKRVMDPDGTPMNKFNGFFKNVYEDTGWVGLPGVLTYRYVATSLEKFVNSILVPQIRLTPIPIVNREPWKSAWLGVSDLTIDYIDVPDMAMHVFTNIAENDIVINSIVSELGFSVTNTYDGSNKLKVTPIVRTVGYNGVSPLTSFIDYLTFSNFTHDISHTSDASGFVTDLTTIRNNVSDHLVVLKQYTDVGFVIDDISKSLKKPGREKFKLVHSSAQLENLFHVLISASIALGKHYSIAEHLSVRSKIRRLFERVF